MENMDLNSSVNFMSIICLIFNSDMHSIVSVISQTMEGLNLGKLVIPLNRC